MQLTRTHRILIGVVVAGAVVIAAIGFAGSYAAVRELALKKGFGDFSLVFPIGIDAGICVLLALDLLLTWIRIPFPLLRQTAWLLTAATIAFNGAAAWPDPLGVGMHAVIPVLFVVTVEAARHAVGRIADITADRHMEGVRITRWLLSPIPTFKLWRRMKLWELRSYEQAVGMEQDRLIYQARLQARYGRAWRRKAPVEALMPLRLARIGVPLSQTAPDGLAAAGIDPVLLPPAAQAIAGQSHGPALPAGPAPAQGPDGVLAAGQATAGPGGAPGQGPDGVLAAGQTPHPAAEAAGQTTAAPAPAQGPDGVLAAGQATAGPGGAPGQGPDGVLAAGQTPHPAAEAAGQTTAAPAPAQAGLPVGEAAGLAPAGPGGAPAQGPDGVRGGAPAQGPDGVRGGAPVSGRGGVGDQAPQGHQPPAFAVDPTAMPAAHDSAWFAAPKAPQAAYEGGYNPQYVEGLEPTPVLPPTGPTGPTGPDETRTAGPHDEDEYEFAEAAYKVLRMLIDEHGNFPTPEALDIHLADGYGVTHPRSASLLRRMMPQLRQRYQLEAEAEHIA
nr:DUF2637 domain-containing protein [Streptomyces venezuelae]